MSVEIERLWSNGSNVHKNGGLEGLVVTFQMLLNEGKNVVLWYIKSVSNLSRGVTILYASILCL